MTAGSTPWAAMLLCVLWLNHAQARELSTPATPTAVQIESLGQPWDKRYASNDWRYARNIWDMRLYGGRLYVGGGNSSNKGPAVNAGPVPVMAYDFGRAAWMSEGQVDDEQIDRFVLLDGTLAIPGHDPRQPWQWGNLYLRNEQGRWHKQRRIPDGVHTYDVVSHAGKWFAALGTGKGGAIAESTNRGTNWQTTYVGPVRVYSLVRAGDKLFGFPALRIKQNEVIDRMLQWQDGVWQTLPVAEHKRWLPDTALKPTGVLKLLSAEPAGLQVAYIAAYTLNDHQAAPIAAYVGGVNPEGRWQATQLVWPHGFAPWDVVARDGHLHWLLNRPTPQGADVQIWRSSVQQPLQTTHALSFSAPTLARALEVQGDGYFVGLGSDQPDPPADTGAVWRVRRE